MCVRVFGTFQGQNHSNVKNSEFKTVLRGHFILSNRFSVTDFTVRRVMFMVDGSPNQEIISFKYKESP